MGSTIVLTDNTYLDENFKLINNYKKYLLYQVHEDTSS